MTLQVHLLIKWVLADDAINSALCVCVCATVSSSLSDYICILKVIEPLIEYISENVGKLGESLLTPIFLK